MEGLALELCQRLADAASEVKAAEQRAKKEMEEIIERKEKLIAQIASERFEFDRLMQRVLPDLEAAGLESLIKIFAVYSKSWDVNLKRAQVEVLDLTGARVTDPLLDLVEVESAVPDPVAGEGFVRETLSPLVKLEGRIIALAKVITTVPAPIEQKIETEERR
jgi:hypothetical protein